MGVVAIYRVLPEAVTEVKKPKSVAHILLLSDSYQVVGEYPDLSFWKQVKVGKTVREVADDWTERHPKDKALGEDTVRKAVDRIDKVMQPDFSA